MDIYYKSWLETEKEWIREYKRVLIKKSFLQTIPKIVIFLGILFGVLGIISGGSVKSILTGLFGGVVTGIFISVFYLLHLMSGLRTGKFLDLIKSAVKEQGMDGTELSILGHEMLEADNSSWRKLSFVMAGPGSNDTPARFKVTPHFAFLEGGAPYAILVRLTDEVRIEPGQEEKTTVVKGSRTGRRQKFTLYTIGFYLDSKKDNKELPDQAMGFFSREIRDQVLDLLKRNAEYEEEI